MARTPVSYGKRTLLPWAKMLQLDALKHVLNFADRAESN